MSGGSIVIILLIAMEEGEEEVRIYPQHAITFYRKERQSAATITIQRMPSCQQTIQYLLKTTQKSAYLVTSASG